MSNITLWYKTAPSETLGSVPTVQKILFDEPDKGIELYDWQDWQNNIKATENSNRTGVRSVNMEDAGFGGVKVILKGHVNTTAPVQDQINLFIFLKILQTPDALPQGVFSIDNPNGPLMTIEATATKGLSITSGTSVKFNPTNKSYDFIFNMIYGGDLT